MIGGFYNTTSLLIEPTKALGTFIQAADGSAMSFATHQDQRGFARPEDGTEAAKVPDVLPAGIVHFIPVVVKMREAKAAEAVEAEAIKDDAVKDDAIKDDAAPKAAAGSDPAAEPQADAAPVRVPEAPEVAEAGHPAATVGHYLTAAEAPESEAPLDTTI
jgi:hypothetical protein